MKRWIIGIAVTILFVAAFAYIVGARSRYLDFGFDRDGDAQGWAPANEVAAFRVGNGSAAIDPSGREALLVRFENFPASSVNWIRIRMRLTPFGGVDPGIYEDIHRELTTFWRPATEGAVFDREHSLISNAYLDGRYHTYDIPVSSHSLWTGEIGAVGFAPLDEASPRAVIEIDRISFLHQRISLIGSWPMLALLIVSWWGLAALVRSRRDLERPSLLSVAPLVLLAPLSLLFLVEATLNLAAFEAPFDDKLVKVLFEEVELPGYDDLFMYDPDCLFTNRPGVDYRHGERINELGLRGRVYSREKRTDTLRVACFGDSSTFGLGLEGDQTYASRLEKLLQQALEEETLIGPSRERLNHAEVINAGIIAYTSLQGFQLFETRISAFQPDLITLAFGAINEQFPSLLSDKERLERVKRFPASLYHTRRFLKDHLKSFQLVNRWFAGSGDASRVTDEVEFNPRVTPEEFSQTLMRFIESAREQGIAVILVSLPRRKQVEQQKPILLEYTHKMVEVAGATEATLLDLREQFQRIPNYESALLLDSVHPNAAGAEFIAGALQRAILDRFDRSAKPVVLPTEVQRQ